LMGWGLGFIVGNAVFFSQLAKIGILTAVGSVVYPIQKFDKYMTRSVAYDDSNPLQKKYDEKIWNRYRDNIWKDVEIPKRRFWNRKKIDRLKDEQMIREAKRNQLLTLRRVGAYHDDLPLIRYPLSVRFKNLITRLKHSYYLRKLENIRKKK